VGQACTPGGRPVQTRLAREKALSHRVAPKSDAFKSARTGSAAGGGGATPGPSVGGAAVAYPNIFSRPDAEESMELAVLPPSIRAGTGAGAGAGGGGPGGLQLQGGPQMNQGPAGGVVGNIAAAAAAAAAATTSSYPPSGPLAALIAQLPQGYLLVQTTPTPVGVASGSGSGSGACSDPDDAGSPHSPGSPMTPLSPSAAAASGGPADSTDREEASAGGSMEMPLHPPLPPAALPMQNDVATAAAAGGAGAAGGAEAGMAAADRGGSGGGIVALSLSSFHAWRAQLSQHAADIEQFVTAKELQLSSSASGNASAHTTRTKER